MTLIDVMPKNDGGEIVVEIGVVVEGKSSPCTINKEWFENAFSAFTSKEVPLSESDYQALLNASSDMWKLNWQELRKQGLI